MIKNENEMRIAELFTRNDSTTSCHLCNHRCHIREGNQGICSVRTNRGGVLYTKTYGKVSSVAVDPIEKKPLYHFLPASRSYSIGGIGCNFSCSHCQNWQISQDKDSRIPTMYLAPDKVVREAVGAGCSSISWTYNEPTLFYEYSRDTGIIAKKNGLKTIYVTNGYLTEEALQGLSGVLDAFRVDIKAFSDSFYRSICGARLQPVLDATRLAYELGMHVETVTLIIPGLNDSMDEIENLISWVIKELGPDVPMHFTRFHPDYQMRDRIPTPVSLLEKIYDRAKELGLRFPYIGNVVNHPYEHTYCPTCGSLLIKRSGYHTEITELTGTSCNVCNETIPIILR